MYIDGEHMFHLKLCFKNDGNNIFKLITSYENSNDHVLHLNNPKWLISYEYLPFSKYNIWFY